MKVNADIYCLHSASSQSPVKESREFTTRGGRRLLHNITTRVRNFFRCCLGVSGAPRKDKQKGKSQGGPCYFCLLSFCLPISPLVHSVLNPHAEAATIVAVVVIVDG